MLRPRLLILATLLALLALSAPASAAQRGVRHLHFRFGPVKVKPGQNTIAFDAMRQRPKVDGYITSFKPNLVRADGKAPPVDVIHLHHAVWLQNLRPTW